MMKRGAHRPLKGLTCVLTVLAVFSMFITTAKNANAQACCSCLVETVIAGAVSSTVNSRLTEQTINARISTELTTQRTFLTSVFWEDNVLPALMLMADQLSAVALYQTQIIGQFFDAKHQLETQRTLQKIRARAHKDYHPSTGMCEFGTNTKSLLASERKSELVAHVLSQRFQDRMLGNANTSAAPGIADDKRTRLKQYRENFCDPMDNGGTLFFLCEHDQDNNLTNSTMRAAPDGGLGAFAPDGNAPERANKDIDYIRTIDYPWTLDMDFSDTTLTDHEEEVIALGDNLYGHDVFPRISGAVVSPEPNAPFPGSNQTIMDARAMLAKLGVAKNSYNAIVSMKAAGTEGSRDFMEAVLSELGVSEEPSTTYDIDDMRRMLGFSTTPGDGFGEEIGPSYYAQMEILTRKIYQNPDFYTNLYDKPVNVERKKVAMQAIGLMQKFDLFKSYLRNEAVMSVLLEIAVSEEQSRLEEEFKNQKEEGTEKQGE